jgi:hypothetical protein
MEIIITTLSALWVFLLTWVLKIQRDLGRMKQNEISIMKDLMMQQAELKQLVPRSECDILHNVNSGMLKAFQEVVNQRLQRIEEGQDDMRSDIKQLLKRK